jgi:hypothetical protein
VSNWAHLLLLALCLDMDRLTKILTATWLSEP